MRNYRRFALYLVTAVMLLAMLGGSVACASAVQGPPSPTASAGVKTGGTLRFPYISQPAGWDPHRKIGSAYFMTLPVFNNLVQLDPTKKDMITENIIGDLADRWEASADGKTWTFHLHPGIKWTDGTSFTADDVVYSIQKILDPKRSLVSQYFSTLDKAVKVDDNTVQLLLRDPAPNLLTMLASNYCAIEPRQTANVDYRTPEFLVGTGPYRLKTLVSGVSATFVKNPDYFKKDSAGRQLPYLDGYTIFWMPDRGAQMNSMLTNQLDMMAPALGLTNFTQLTQFQSQAPKDAVVLRSSPYNGNILYLNNKFEPFKNPDVRRAIVLLADREQLCVATFGTADWGNKSRAFFTESFGLPTSEIYSIMGWNRPYEDRVAEAKQLLAKAGYGGGLKLRILTTSGVPEFKNRNTWLADQMRKVNIQAELVMVTGAEVYTMRDAGNYELLDLDSLASLGDPDEIKALFRTGSTNFSGYSNAQIDKLFDQQSLAMDPAQRKAICQQIERTLLTDSIAIPIETHTHATALYPYVKGFVLQNAVTSSALAFERTWLDK